MAKPERKLVSVLRGSRENLLSVLGLGVASGVPRPEAGMDLRRVEAVGIRRASNELSELIRQIDQGVHYLLLRFDQPVAALISHADYLAYSELARQDALAKALLQGKGYDPESLSPQEYLNLLAANLKEESNGVG
jgi:antitoxin (DNA-binding transcriptional repressor) of toxin-antitoxin stability system